MDFEEELRRAVNRILASGAPKKLIVAGPGTGKTTLFRKLLEQTRSGDRNNLVLTFINNLKDELHEKLSDIAQVSTFHGYCHFLLRRDPYLRTGLSDEFHYFPSLASLIKTDWELLHGGEAPRFVGAMRALEEGPHTEFYIKRSDYYDAVEFDDSVFRVYKRLAEDPSRVPRYELVVVDEFQDFNALEAALIDLLARHSPIVIVGDDDQALYSQLRGSSHEYIRGLYHRGDYECLELPFCMRSPEVIVAAFDDILRRARTIGRLEGRIDKPFRYYPPRKAADSKRYPKISVFETSVQSKPANYIGRCIETMLPSIPAEEIRESRREGFPTVLIIGPIHFLRQIGPYLREKGWAVDFREEPTPVKVRRQDGLCILAQDEGANLGWRVVLEADRPAFFEGVLRTALAGENSLVILVPDAYRETTLKEAKELPDAEPTAAEEAQPTAEDETRPRIKLTSFEGSKGLSAQHVFIVGLQEGELPRDAKNPTDLEICRLLVALTRTRKQCSIAYTKMFSGKRKRASLFLSWVGAERKRHIRVTADTWRRRRRPS